MVRPDAASTRAEFAVALTALRESAGLSVRELARRVDAPAGTLGDYFSGRHVPSASQLPILRAVLEQCGVTDEDDLQGWYAAVGRARASSDRRLSRGAAPYPGLRSFDEQDAAVFYGRRELTATILRRIDELAAQPGGNEGMLAVLGPSGSGKSSVLRAGVVAALRADPDRSVTIVTPSTHDAAAISAALTAGPAAKSHVLVIDQLEELFTSLDAAQRAEVLDVLVARDSEAPGTPVILGLRADFYAAAAHEPILFPALANAPVLVPPLAATDLRAAIVEPARRRGMTVEPGLVDLISSELAPRGRSAFAHDSGTLPLLSHALLGTWDRAEHNRLTVAAYRVVGGIAGAVQLSAEHCWSALSAEQRKIARALFLRLVHVDENGAATRRRVGREEFDETDTDSAAVLDAFVQARLLTVDASSVQISHEALLSAWPRLQDWLDADRSGQLLHRQLTHAANVWDSDGRNDGDLLRGVRLADAQAWADAPGHDGRLNAREQDFLRAGEAAAQAERRQGRRRTRRQRSLLAAVATLAVVASGLAVYALKARSDEANQRQSAAGDRNRLTSQRIANEAQLFAKSDPALAEQLAIIAYRIKPTDNARAELISASGRAPVDRVLGPAGFTPLAVTSTASGAFAGAANERRATPMIAVGHADDGSVHLYAPNGSGRPTALGVVRGAGASARVNALSFSGDGQRLVIAGASANATIYNVADPLHPMLIAKFPTGLPAATSTAALSPDGTRLVLGGSGPDGLVEWTLPADGRPVRSAGPSGFPRRASARAVAFSADGRQLAVGASDGYLRVWQMSVGAHRPAASGLAPASTAPVVVQAGGGSVDAVAFDPAQDRLVTGTAAGTLTVWRDAGSARLLPTHVEHDPARGRVTALAFSPEGAQLAVGGADDVVHQWDIASWTEQPSVPNPEVVTGVGYPAQGTVVSTTADGVLRTWPRAAPALSSDGPVYGIDFDASGDAMLVVTRGARSGVRLWNVTDPTRPTASSPLVPVSSVDNHAAAIAAVRPDAAELATGDGTGRVRLWDTQRPTTPRAIGSPWRAVDAASEAMTFSPNGRLLAVAGDDGETAIWDVHDPIHPSLLATPRAGGSVLSVRFSPNGRLLAAASTDRTVHLWDVRDPHRAAALPLLTGFNGSVYGVAFSPDSTVLAATAADRHTRLFGLKAPSKPTRIAVLSLGPSGYPSAPSFNPDGKLLAVPSYQHALWIYDVHDPARANTIAVLRQTNQNAYVATFAPRGSTLAGGGSNPITPLWNVDFPRYVKALCTVVGDRITRQEWARDVSGVRYRPPCG